MSDELREFLSAYDTHRVADQTKFYEERAQEYERSAGQLGWVNELALFAAAVCGVLAAVWTEYAVWFGVAAAALAAVGAALTSWAEVIGFASNAELYRATRAGLGRLRPERPTDDASPEQVAGYVAQVEDVLLGEVRAWGEYWGSSGDSGDSDS